MLFTNTQLTFTFPFEFKISRLIIDIVTKNVKSIFPFIQQLPQVVSPNADQCLPEITQDNECKDHQLDDLSKAIPPIQQMKLPKIQDERKLEKSEKVKNMENKVHFYSSIQFNLNMPGFVENIHVVLRSLIMWGNL